MQATNQVFCFENGLFHSRLNATRFGPACEQISDTTFDNEKEQIRQAANMWNYKVSKAN